MKIAVTGVALLAVALGGCGSMNPMRWWSGEPQEQAPQRLRCRDLAERDANHWTAAS